MNDTRRATFAFVIPVRNPDDDKVSDYTDIEAILVETLRSLTKQIHRERVIVVVCHRIPPWADSFEGSVVFLDVGHVPAFAPNRNEVRVDKGLKYVLGAMFVITRFAPRLIMLMDCDDYVNVHLASALVEDGASTNHLETDGYVVKNGIHVKLGIGRDHRLHFDGAFEVREFDKTCGSSRIFKTNALLRSIRQLNPEIEDRLSQWPQVDGCCVKVPAEGAAWLDEATKPGYAEQDNLVNVLGRHVRQEAFFRFTPLPFLGAAKGCGHGNHDGPRQGELHWKRVVRIYPIEKFYESFGISGTPARQSWLETSVRNLGYALRILAGRLGF